MNKILLSLLVSAVSIRAEVKDYRHAKDYAGMTYNILQSYIDHNPNCSAHDVRMYLNKNKPVFNDARDMGYDRMLIVRCTYCLALDVEPRNEKILEALRLELKTYKMWREIIYWGSLGCTVFSTVTCLALIPMTGRMYKDFLTH